MNSASPLASTSRRRRTTVLTAALTLPLLAVTACGTTTGAGTPGGRSRSVQDDGPGDGGARHQQLR